MKVGDFLLVIGPGFFEKAEVVSKNKKVYTLNNGIKLNRHRVPLNSRMSIEPWDEVKFNFLKSKRDMTKTLEKVSAAVKNYKGSMEDFISAHSKMNRILKKLENAKE